MLILYNTKSAKIFISGTSQANGTIKGWLSYSKVSFKSVITLSVFFIFMASLFDLKGRRNTCCKRSSKIV